MTEIINNYKFSEELPGETEAMQNARRAALELGQTPISAALGQQVAMMVMASGAQNVVEIGTGTGLNGLWILQGNPAATLTSIDSDATNHDLARHAFSQGAPAQNAQRLITGKPEEVLPRLNEASYDLAIFDASSPALADYLMHALRLVKTGGIVLAYHPLKGGKLASPTARDEHTAKIRELLSSLPDLNVQWNLLAVGSGLLQIVKR